MADENSVETASSSEVKGKSAESTVEINVKTLDSQIYSFQVDKNMPVPLLKEKVANASGVPVEQQRLIFRGKVLKDEHLLSEYHVEDGHTLHLVARQPIQSETPPETNGNNANANQGNEAGSGAPRSRIGQVSHSVVLGTFNMGDQGEGIGPDITRIVGAVLNSMGLGNQIPNGGANNVSSGIPASQGVETNEAQGNIGGRSRAGQGQPGQAFPSHPFQSLTQSLPFPLAGAGVAAPLQMPIPDALHTLSEFINRMEQALSTPGYQPSPPPINVGDPQTANLPSIERRMPTPEVLSIILRQAQQLLSGHAAAALSRIAGRLEGEGGSTDPAIRSQIQSESVQVGLAMQHLGALFLELGRTILTLRMGQSPAEALVNAGPAVYISPAGPNPIMVQPFPLQTSSLFGASQFNSGMMGPVAHGDAPRNVNIHIHAVGSRLNPGDATHQEHSNGTGSGDSGSTRVLPVRNVIATAGPLRSPAEVAAHVINARTAPNNASYVAPAQNSGVAVSSSLQPGGGNSVLQPLSDSGSVPTIVAELNAQMRTLVDNMQRENQVPPGQPEDSTLQGSSIGVSTGSNGGNHQHENLAVSTAEQTSGSSSACISERKEQQQPQTSGNLGSKDAPSTSSNMGSLSCSSVEGTISYKSEDSSEAAPKDSWNHNPAGDKSVPLGLGLGGLQPRRRSRQAREGRSQGKNGGGMGSSNPPVNQNKQSSASGQRVLQSLASHGLDGNTRSVNGSSGQLPPAFSQVIESLPMGASGSNGQIDAASMMSQVLNSPALNGLLAGVSEQAGIGSPDGLRNMLEQFTQSPSMRNTLNQIVQQMDDQDLGSFPGMGRGQSGGLDLSRMVQQMMPIVSQALTRGPANPEPISGLESTSQRQYDTSSSVRDNKPDEQNCQIDLQEAAQRIERRDPPGDIFRTVVENAGILYGGGSDSEDLIEELCSDEDLANEFVEMLQRNIRERLQEDSGFADMSSI